MSKQIYFAILSCFLLLLGCSPIPEDFEARTCIEADDCMSEESCINGLCREKSALGEQGSPKTDKKPDNPSTPKKNPDGSRDPNKKPDEKPAQKKPKAPECLSPKPECKPKGVCQGIVPICKQKRWSCDYPTTFEEKESLCDGKDNDCNGVADEGCSCQPDETQACGNGQGACKQGIQTCGKSGEWGRCVGAVGASVEVCDGVDNDCDGLVDESMKKSCYNGPTGTGGVGVCEMGIQICTNGAWGACEGQVEPVVEVCDGVDNDCDGLVDESMKRSCYSGAKGTTGVGKCLAGVQLCSQGGWGSCQGESLPSIETCDGVDNDCDGQVDEHIKKSCYTGPIGTKGKGRCRGGSQVCLSGAWGACQGEIKPVIEICDGVDNDCDGQVDENIKKSCYTGPIGTQGKGRCRGGSQVCLSGSWGTCQGEVKPVIEVCDGVDNDCDGQVDENIKKSCYTGPIGTQGKGRCRGGSQVCLSGAWGACQGEVKPVIEVCDGVDNDCDGQVDENIKRACYTGPAGTQGKGRCRGGSQVCLSGAWGACQGEVKPQTDLCDGVDNDCDGKVDEGRSICGSRKVCTQAKCQCDVQNGYRAYGSKCIKDGDICPASLRNKTFCATSNHWVLCDPFGRVGIVHCPSFSGGQCLNVAGGSGCKAPPSMYLRGSCLSLTAGYGAKKTWHVVMTGLGPDKNNSVVSFQHCVGNGRQFCGTIVTSAGNITSCMCGERKTYCSGLKGDVYDPIYPDSNGQCSSFNGRRFGCPGPATGKSACSKGYVKGFATYACGI